MDTRIWKTDSYSSRSFGSSKAIGWQVNTRPYSWSPPTDVYENDVSLIVRLEVAGMRESDFTINVDKNYLVISGMRAESPERRAYHQMEIRFGEFSTAIELPSDLDVNKTEAQYEDGFLTVILPKIKPSEIRIKG